MEQEILYAVIVLNAIWTVKLLLDFRMLRRNKYQLISNLIVWILVLIFAFNTDISKYHLLWLAILISIIPDAINNLIIKMRLRQKVPNDLEIAKVTPICTNLRYDGTNKTLNFDIGELRHQNVPGDIKVFSDKKIIYEDKFKRLFDIPQIYSFQYEPQKDNEIIEAILTLNGYSTSIKITLNDETTRNPITWEEWENKGK